MHLLKYVFVSLLSASFAFAITGRNLTRIVKDVELSTSKLTHAVKTLSAKELATTRKLDPVALDLIYELGNATADFRAYSGKIGKKLSKTLLRHVKTITTDIKRATAKLTKEAPQVKEATSADAVAEIDGSLQSIGGDYAAFGKALEDKLPKSEQKKARKGFKVIAHGFKEVAKAYAAQ